MVSRPSYCAGDDTEESSPSPSQRSLVVPLIGGALHGHTMVLPSPLPEELEIVNKSLTGGHHTSTYRANGAVIGSAMRYFYAAEGMPDQIVMIALADFLWSQVMVNEAILDD